jgi:uncharacterized protein (TIGR02284 family)
MTSPSDEQAISTDEEAISTLNELIETCRDGENSFRAAGDTVQDTNLKSLFHTCVHQRAEFAGELQQEVRRLGGQPERGGSIAGSFRRGWIGARPAVSGGSDPSIIAEAERGEDQAVKSYREALGANLPPRLKAIVERQFEQIQRSHDLIRSLGQQRRAA